jgi:hypothetical protein
MKNTKIKLKKTENTQFKCRIGKIGPKKSQEGFFKKKIDIG